MTWMPREAWRQADIVTIEFENIPASTLQALGEAPVAPDAHVLATTRHRIHEKPSPDNGFPVTEFAQASSLNELQAGCEAVGLPVIVKTCEFGYDGKVPH